MQVLKFNFDSNPINAHIDEHGNPWFVAKDVCAVLEIEKHRDAVARLDEDERGSVVLDTLGGPQDHGVINESGLYSLVMTSRKPEAKRFKKWVTSEVLPSIRKTGGYQVQQSPSFTLPNFMDPAEAAMAWATEYKAKQAAQLQIAHMKPFADFGEAVSASATEVLIGEWIKAINDGGLKMGRTKVFQWLRDHKYLTKSNLPYQQYIDQGLFKVKESLINVPGGQKVRFTTLMTGKGQVYFANKLTEKDAHSVDTLVKNTKLSASSKPSLK